MNGGMDLKSWPRERRKTHKTLVHSDDDIWVQVDQRVSASTYLYRVRDKRMPTLVATFHGDPPSHMFHTERAGYFREKGIEALRRRYPLWGAVSRPQLTVLAC